MANKLSIAPVIEVKVARASECRRTHIVSLALNIIRASPERFAIAINKTASDWPRYVACHQGPIRCPENIKDK